MRRTALLIGAETFGLSGVGNDVEKMANLLAPRGFAVGRQEGRDAGREGILHGLERLIRDARHEDAVVIYYSGHGGTAAPPRALAAGHRAAAPRLQFIVPTDYGGPDFRGITAVELSVYLARLTEVTPNVTVILDTCHSAHMMRNGDLRPKALHRPAYIDVAEHLSRLRRQGLDPTARHVLGNQDAVRIVACGRDESAYEYTDSAGHRIGILTESMALALVEAGGTTVTWAALMERVRRRVRESVPNQRPEAEGPSGRMPFQTIGPRQVGPLPALDFARSPDGAKVAIEWGRVIGRRRYPLPLRGSTLHADERVYVDVRNDGDTTVYVSLFYDGIASRRSLITSLDPSGIAIRPGEEHTVGSDEFDGRLEGFALPRPPGGGRGGALPATIAVLVSSVPQDFSGLLRYRDIGAPAETATRCDVHRILFWLEPGRGSLSR